MKQKQFLQFCIVSLVVFFSACQKKAQQPEPKNNELTSEALSPALPYPDWAKNAVLYEVNVRQFSPEGTFKAFDGHLPRLKKLGVDILWFMPIHPIGEKNRKGTLGSYYAVKDYKAINPEFGTAQDFRETVKKAHDLGFKVLIDWVANHTSPDNAWVTEHPDWYKRDSIGNIIAPYDWTDTAQLDYGNKDMRAAMIDAMKFWVSEFDIDGFRCDVAGMVPVDFWEDAREQLDAIKPIFMLAEDEEKNELMQKAFDANYGWEMHHVFAEIYKGKKNASAIVAVQQKYDSIFPKDAVKMNFITNHDENSWNGTIEEKFGKGAKAFAVLTYTLPGMPLIYSGQEANVKKRIEFFEKDPIAWTDTTFVEFYQKLNQIKHTTEALFNPPYGGSFVNIDNSNPKQALSFLRKGDKETVLVMVNVSAKPVSFVLADDALAGTYQNIISSKNDTGTILEKMVKIGIEPWGYRVWKK